MENMSANDSLLQNDISNRNYQNYSPSTSCSLSTSGSTYSLSSSPNSINSYGTQHESPCNRSMVMSSPPQNNCKRRGSEPAINHSYAHHYHRTAENSPEYLNSSMSDENNASQTNIELNCTRPVNRFFPDGVVDILNKWFYENQNYPYPDENMTNILAKEANISAKQVRKWFANKRVRSNKCYKQTFRIRKDLQNSKVHINRRQTKSVSDGESLHANQMSYYDDAFEDENPKSRLPELLPKPYIWHNEPISNISTSSGNSSASSSPSSYAYSSPILKSEIPNSNFYQQHNNQNVGMSHSYSLNSFEQLQAAAAASQNVNNSNTLAALYNPLFLMNILQNPSMALQAVLANRLISMNNSDNTNEKVNDLTNTMQSTPIQKRKTHLSNRFHNESTKHGLHQIQEVATDIQCSVKSEKIFNDNNTNQKNCNSTTTKAHLKDLIGQVNQNDSTCSNNKSVRSSFSLDELSTSINSTNPIQFTNNQQKATNNNFDNNSYLSPKPTKKINFGDISSLI